MPRGVTVGPSFFFPTMQFHSSFFFFLHTSPLLSLSSSTMSDHSRLYMGTAFVAGVCLTVLCKDLFYPELEDRLREYRARHRPAPSTTDEEHPMSARPGPPAIVDGVEGCIGNTPLFRIKSLSDVTGCEILGKAEVCDWPSNGATIHLTNVHTVLERRRSELQRPSRAQHD